MELELVTDNVNSMREYFFSGLKNQRSLEHLEMDLFRWFRNETEKAWALMEAEESTYIRAQVAARPDDVNDSGIIAVNYYCKRMRYSQVIFLTSLLESAMKRECSRLSTTLGEKVMFEAAELKGDPWSARKTFLERHGKFQTPADQWRQIKDLLVLRNAIVHHNGERSLLTKEQRDILKKIAGIDLENFEVGIAKSYLDRATESVCNLMEFLHNTINETIDRALKPQAM